MRSGRISERATIVETSSTKRSSSSVTRLVTSSSVVAWDLSALARLVMAAVSPSATVRVSPMVRAMSESQVPGWMILASGTDGEVVAICSARISSEDATSTWEPLTVLL